MGQPNLARMCGSRVRVPIRRFSVDRLGDKEANRLPGAPRSDSDTLGALESGAVARSEVEDTR
jgi:hypothetical protein